MRTLFLLGLAALALGCNLGGDKPSAKQDTSPAPAASTGQPEPRPLPPGRSAVPSLSQYAAAREVTVKGSTALNCETKMVREWLRVTCRGKNDTGGTPTTVRVSRGGRGETIVFAAGGVTSVITPVLEGTDFEARFSWTNKSHPLVVKWPRGTQKPIVLGEFQGAASPLDGTAPSALMCDCHKKLTGSADCIEAPMAQPDCERTFDGNCAKILACARGEPGVWPTCPPGKRNAGATGWCAALCGPGRPPCAAGLECTREWGDPNVCL